MPRGRAQEFKAEGRESYFRKGSREPQARGSTESGVGWFAWMVKYMDDIGDNQRHWLNDELTKLPSDYMKRPIVLDNARRFYTL